MSDNNVENKNISIFKTNLKGGWVYVFLVICSFFLLLAYAMDSSESGMIAIPGIFISALITLVIATFRFLVRSLIKRAKKE